MLKAQLKGGSRNALLALFWLGSHSVVGYVKEPTHPA